MKKTLKRMAVGLVLTMGFEVAQAGEPIEVVQIKYVNGTVDYIDAESISRITFSKGLGADDSQFQAVGQMFDLMKAFGGSVHYDFGYPALMIGLDSQGPDMYCLDSGYNWFSAWHKYAGGDPKGVPNNAMWFYCYNYINAANKILESIGNPTTDQEKLYASQALALRSFGYWNLVQTFADNYSFAPDAEAVVLVTEVNNESAFSGTPQALSTTRQVYDLILQDINQAIEYLANNKMEPAYLDVANAKRYVDLSVAYGLRARYNLTLHRYGEAAYDARKSIELSSCSPLLMNIAGQPGFNDAKYGNWMWAITVDEIDRCTTSGICNFASFVCSFGYGYVTVGAQRYCGPQLWNYLSEWPKDVRLQWFLDDNDDNPNLTKSQKRYLTELIHGYNTPNLNVKFDAYKKMLGTGNHAEDIPLMRIEEMYLIEAEGLVMSGRVSEGRDRLCEFVRSYRNPDYMTAASDMQTLQEEILMQRRAEFWGEGLSYFDMLRLHRDLDRYDDICSDDFRLRIKGGSKHFIYARPNRLPYIMGYEPVEIAAPTAGADWNE